MGRKSKEQKIINKDIREIVEKNIHLVEIVVRKIAPSLPDGMAREELVSEGVLGLIEAAQKYDPSRGIKFEHWAEIRIKGAIIDYLRKTDALSRSSRLMVKQIANTIKDLQNKFGREPTDEEVAKELGLSLEDYHIELERISNLSIVSLDEVVFDQNSSEGKLLYELINDESVRDPFKFSENSNLRKIIEKSLEKLDEREREIIKLYYLDGLHMKEISKKLNVSESRISQIHSKALLKLRKELEGKVLV